MEKINLSVEIPTIEKIRKTIDESPQKIQEEIERSGNRWLACIITRASITGSYLNVGRRTGEISPENYQESKNKLNSLIKKIYDLQKQYNIKRDISDEIKSELIIELTAAVNNL